MSYRIGLCWVALFLLMFPLSAQNRNVTGTVVDKNGLPLTGANVVLVEKTSVGTIVDARGNFSITVPENAALSFSFIGFKTKILRLGKSVTHIRVVLEEDLKVLEDVVVTALGISREAKSLGYARQAIDAESLSDLRDPNLLNSLSGKVAGVNFISNGGPLSSTRVEIRGNNSLTGNNQPLYVVDGVPISNPMGENGDLDYGNPASFINPDEIASIEVLKGANAAALYGSDAANGVILITTRKPVNKKGLGISYNFNMQYSFLREYPLYQNIYGVAYGVAPGDNRGTNYPTCTPKNGYEYNPNLPYGIYVFNWHGMNQRSWGLPMLGFEVVGRNNEIRTYSPTKNTVSDMYRVGRTMTNSVTIDKVFNGASFRFGYTMIDYQGILDQFDLMKRHTFNLRADVNLTKWLKMEANANYQLENTDNRDFKGDSSRNPLRAIMNLPRDATVGELVPWKDSEGRGYSREGFYNPYWLVNECSNADDRTWFRGTLGFTVKIVKNLDVRLRASIDNSTKNGWIFDNYYSIWDIDGRYQTFKEENKNYNYEALLNYKTNWKNLSISANLGTSLQKNEGNKLVSTVDHLAAPDIKSLSNNAYMLSSNSSYYGKEKQSVYGMLSFGYKGFFIDGTFRNDWSSSLPKANNSYFYSSGSMAWVLTDMFPKLKSKVLTFAKLRGSIARVGNDCGFDQLINGYTYGGLFRDNMPWFSGDSYRKNPFLKPETTISKEIGAEFRFMNNRLIADITYYDKSTHDQIVQSTLSYLSGYQRRLINSGEISNKGWEISLSGSPVKIRNFEWKTTVNWSKNNSMVKSLPDGIDKIEIGSGMNDTKSYAEVGKPYGALYAHTYKRDEAGHILCSQDGSPKEADVMKYVGCVQADWRGGWSNQFRIGRVQISCMIDFQKGGMFLSQSATVGATDGQTVQSLQGRDAYFYSARILGESNDERYGFLRPNDTNNPNNYQVLYPDWQRPKGVVVENCVYDNEVEGLAGQPVLGWANPENYWMHHTRRNMERFIYDASYIKLREITVSYELPKSWLRNLPLQTVRVAAVGRNIATLFSNTPKGLDPQATSTTGNAQGFERGFNLPSATYGFDIKVSF